VGRNTDFHPLVCRVLLGSARPLVVTVDLPGTHSFTHVSFPFFAGVLNGYNDRGIAVNAHQILSVRDGAPGRQCATPLLKRIILEGAGTVSQADAIIRTTGISRALNLMVTSLWDRASVVYEIAPDGHATVRSGRDHLCCTTHFRSPAMRARHTGNTGRSERRLRSMEEWIEDRGDITVPDGLELLGNSKNGTSYRHSGISISNNGTFQSFLIDMAANRIHISNGRKAPVPATGEYVELKIDMERERSMPREMTV
jgi:hypothetical protein